MTAPDLATPGPWEIETEGDRYVMVMDESLSLTICSVHEKAKREIQLANAALIVRAVNSHAALVAALEALVGVTERMPNSLQFATERQQARAALALARQS